MANKALKTARGSARELLVAPLPNNDLLSQSLLVVPVPDGVEPDRALSLIAGALKLAASTAGKDRADLVKLLGGLTQYGDALILPWSTRMIASSSFFDTAKLRRPQ
jgi:hypothetical protein